jgi:hypothetical protein
MQAAAVARFFARVDRVPLCSISKVYSLFDLETASLAPFEFATPHAAIVRLIGCGFQYGRDSAIELFSCSLETSHF